MLILNHHLYSQLFRLLESLHHLRSLLDAYKKGMFVGVNDLTAFMYKRILVLVGINIQLHDRPLKIPIHFIILFMRKSDDVEIKISVGEGLSFQGIVPPLLAVSGKAMSLHHRTQQISKCAAILIN